MWRIVSRNESVKVSPPLYLKLQVLQSVKSFLHFFKSVAMGNDGRELPRSNGCIVFFRLRWFKLTAIFRLCLSFSSIVSNISAFKEGDSIKAFQINSIQRDRGRSRAKSSNNSNLLLYPRSQIKGVSWLLEFLLQINLLRNSIAKGGLFNPQEFSIWCVICNYSKMCLVGLQHAECATFPHFEQNNYTILYWTTWKISLEKVPIFMKYG